MSSLTFGGAVAVSASTGGWFERAHGLAEAEVRGAEVVPPLRDAVRLVDDEQRDLARSRGARGTAARRGAPA